MAKNIELLLVESVENLGLVGEVVRVRAGYARNYLLPLGMAEFPTEARIAELQSARVEAAAKADALREEQEATLGKLGGIVLTLRRSNERQRHFVRLGSQRDISDALIQGGFNVGISAVRLSVAIRRTGNYDVPIQFGKELRENITVVVESESVIEEMADDAPEEGGEAAVEAGVDASAQEAAEATLTSPEPSHSALKHLQPGQTAGLFYASLWACGCRIPVTSSCSAPPWLAMHWLGESQLSPRQLVNFSPVARAIGASHSMSHGWSRGSTTTSTRPASSSQSP